MSNWAGPPQTKAQHIQRELVAPPATRAWLLQSFSHVWAVDEDLAFPTAASAVGGFLELVKQTRAAVAQPSLRGVLDSGGTGSATGGGASGGGGGGGGGGGDDEDDDDEEACAVRATDFVASAAAIMQTCVFVHAYTHLHTALPPPLLPPPPPQLAATVPVPLDAAPSVLAPFVAERVWCRYYGRFSPWRRVGACRVIALAEGGGFAKVAGLGPGRLANRSAAVAMGGGSVVHDTEAAALARRCATRGFRQLQSGCRSVCCPPSAQRCELSHVASGGHQTFPCSSYRSLGAEIK